MAVRWIRKRRPKSKVTESETDFSGLPTPLREKRPKTHTEVDPIRRKRLQEMLVKVRDEREAKRPKPTVMTEWQTLEMILSGHSISRYGDGEVKHMDGRRNVSQTFHESLQERLREVFHSRLKGHLVAIPNVYNGRTFTEVSGDYIKSMRRRFSRIADRKYTYGSAYITRGDLCPYMSWPSYWSLIFEIWKGRDVVLVRGHAKRAAPDHMLAGSKSVSHVETLSSGAWSHYHNILNECLCYPKESLYLLCVGPTATVLAHDLCKTKRQAVDLGHLGLFYRRLGIEDDRYRQTWSHRPTDPGYMKGVTDQC